jgi:RNA polymerase sigma-70 factor (ECF subfamily)
VTDLARPFVDPLERMDSPSANAERMRALYKEQLGYVWTALRRLGIHRDDLEDLTQDVFLRVFRDWDRYDQTRAVRPWLFSIAYHLAIDFLRHQKRVSVAAEELPDLVSDRPGPDFEVAQAQERRVLERILLSIDIDRRTVLVMHDLLGHPVPEIATALEIPLNTAYSRLRLARADFDARVQRWKERP